MGYTIGQISNILLKADRTMYKIGQIAYDDMFAEDSEALDYERDIIFIYKKAVEYGDDLFIGTTKLDALVEKLASKISVYDYGLLTPVYADVLTSVSNLVIGAAGLNDLTDVTISNILDNQILRYNATLGQWVNVAPGSAIRNSQTFIATNGQTVFTTSYPFDSGLFDVYLNGVRLNTSSYTTMGEYQITLLDGALVDDIIDVVIYDADTNILNPINSLSDLDDVLIGGLSNQQGLYFNTTSGKWENGAVFVPYTGAIANVNLGTFDLTADIVTANTLVKAGGTSTQILRADGQVYTFPLAISSPTSGQVLKYNGTSWVNDSDAGITGTGVAGQVAYWSGTGTQTGSNNLFWDATNNRLGIGTNTPLQALTLTGGRIEIQGSNSIAGNGISLGYFQTFYGWIQTWASLPLLLNGSGNNVIIGVGYTADNGNRLQVLGNAYVRGSGNTSSTTALTVQNSDGTNMLRVRNDGAILYGVGAYIAPIAVSTGSINPAGQGLGFYQNDGSSVGRSFNYSGASIVTTSGVRNNIQVLQTFAPTSGTAVFNNLALEQTINQTGGANGITRGLYVNPTLTAAADWRSIEWSNNTGWGLYGSGTANNLLNGNLGIGVIPSAWSTANSIKALQFGGGSIISFSNDRLFIGQNIFFNAVGGAETYINSAAASLYRQFAGGHVWFNAPSGTAGNPITFTQAMTLFGTGNLVLNSTTDSGQRLQVIGDTLLRGSGNTSATTALTVQNSSSQNAFRILNNGQINVGNSASSPIIRTVTEASVSVQDIAGTKLLFASQDTETGSNPSFHFGSNTLLHTSGNLTFGQFSRDFAPTSGTGTVTTLRIAGSINQTGGANGITRGLYINPTLTSAFDFRAIETSAGNVLFGSNFFWDNANNRLRINTQFAVTNEQNFNVYGSALFQQAIGDNNKIYIGNNTSLSTSDGRLLITPNRIKLNDRLTALIISADNIDLGANIILNGRDSDSGSLGLAAANNYALKIFGATRNIAIQNGGTFTDLGQRLQVVGDTLLRGSGNTSATTALLVQNSDSTSLFSVRNDGLIRVGNSGGAQFSAPQIYTSFSNETLNTGGATLVFNHRDSTVGTTNGGFFYTGTVYSPTSGANVFLNIARNFEPTSGTASFSLLQIRPAISQTGGANGITRGLYVNPNLALGSGPADWRSIEWSNNSGWGLRGEGTAPNYLGGRLQIGSTTSTGEALQVTGTARITGAVTLSNYLNGALSTNSTGVVTIEPSFSDLSLSESYAFDIQNYYVSNGYTLNPMDTGYQYARLLRSGQLRNATMLLIPQATKTSLLALNIPTADMSVVRATTATRVNKLGFVETVSANVARIDYTANGDALLVEPQSTNIVQRSDDFANAYWIKSLGTLTSNAITAPDGTLTADLFTKTSAVNTVSRIHATPYTTTGNHTFSIFIKQNVGNDVLFRFDGSGNAANFTFNFATKVLTNLGVISSSFQEFKNGWFRITATANVTNTGWQLDVLNLFPNATNDSVYVWGAQLETGSSMTSYIPTVAASVTRDADVITYSGLTGNSVITETFENGTTNTITNPTTYTISQGRLKSAIRI